MIRVSHVLKANHRKTTLAHLIAVDTLAHVNKRGGLEEVHQLRLAAAVYWSPARKRQKERLTEWHGSSAEPFWQWVIDQLPSRAAATVIAEDAAYSARLLDMFGWMAAKNWRLTKLSMDSPPFIAHWSEPCPTCDLAKSKAGISLDEPGRKRCNVSKHRSVKVWSIVNYVGFRLAALAESLGETLSAAPSSRSGLVSRRAHTLERAHLLARWYRTYTTSLANNDLGNLAPTVAAQAWNAYRHRFMDTAIYIHSNEEVLALERSAYFGGRCECRLLGDLSGPEWTHLDVNAMYPYVMKTTAVPYRLITTRKNPPIDFLERVIKRYCVVAKVTVETDEPIYPYRHEGALAFPVGTFTTALCTPELVGALRRGHVLSCSEVAVYDSAVLFRTYVDHLWAMRIAARHRGDRVSDLIAKLLMNALYGKFGQKAPRWEPISDADPDAVYVDDYWHVPTQSWWTLRVLGGKVYRKVDGAEGGDSFPAIAAHITSAARAHLWSLLGGLDRWDVAYMDTDGILCSPEATGHLAGKIAPETLGGLKVENVSDRLIILGPKWYRHGDRVITKGARLEAPQLADPQLTQWHWQGLSWSIADGQIDRVVRKRVEMNYRHEYARGSILEDGRVLPLTVH